MKTGRTTPGVVELGVKLNKTRTNTMKMEDGEIPIKRGSLQMSYQYALEGVVIGAIKTEQQARSH